MKLQHICRGIKPTKKLCKIHNFTCLVSERSINVAVLVFKVNYCTNMAMIVVKLVTRS